MPAAVEALLGADERLYIAVLEGEDHSTVDVLARDGTFLLRLLVAGPAGLAEALLRDATGHPPRPATVEAFTEEIVGHLPPTGFAISSSEVCAWLLLRAIDPAHPH